MPQEGAGVTGQPGLPRHPDVGTVVDLSPAQRRDQAAGPASVPGAPQPDVVHALGPRLHLVGFAAHLRDEQRLDVLRRQLCQAQGRRQPRLIGHQDLSPSPRRALVQGPGRVDAQFLAGTRLGRPLGGDATRVVHEVDVDLTWAVVTDGVGAHLRGLHPLGEVPAPLAHERQPHRLIGAVGEEQPHIFVPDAGGRIVVHVRSTQADAHHARAEPMRTGDHAPVDARLVGLCRVGGAHFASRMTAPPLSAVDRSLA